MALPDLYFDSSQEIDKVIYTKTGTQSVAANSLGTTTTFAHGMTYKFLPLIDYSWDGSNWYSNMATVFQFDSVPSQYTPVLNARVECDDTNVTITWFSGNFGTKNVQYKIEGISVD